MYQHTSLHPLYSPHRTTNTHHCTALALLPTHTTVPTVQPSQNYQHTLLYLLYIPLGTYTSSDIALSSSSGSASSSISPRTAADETLNDSGMSSADCMRLSQPETDTVGQAMLCFLRYKTCSESKVQSQLVTTLNAFQYSTEVSCTLMHLSQLGTSLNTRSPQPSSINTESHYEPLR